MSIIKRTKHVTKIAIPFESLLSIRHSPVLSFSGRKRDAKPMTRNIIADIVYTNDWIPTRITKIIKVL
jgi:hypothetical protein